ncbi:MAG: hypothetical protein DMG88_02700 [Acidobacteria bacterium]|nr:MAG: hypothetical protein DMG88_02700 [Acidobacteriota bacterium]
MKCRQEYKSPHTADKLAVSRRHLLPLTLIHLPIALAMVSEPQKTILGIVALVAVRAHQIAAPCRALTVIVFRDREAGAATARNEKHSYRTYLGLRLAA